MRQSKKRADEIFSFLNILKISSQVTKFQYWLKKHHNTVKDKEIFEGYRFFIDSCIRGLLYKIYTDDSLELNEDYTLYRAHYVGVPIDEIPNTCEKIIFIKNIWQLTKNIRKSRNWDELDQNIRNLQSFYKCFDSIYKKYVLVLKKNLNKNEALKLSSIFRVYVYFNDARRGIPLAYLINPILKSTANKKYLEKVYIGYMYTLQYVWFILLGKEFEKCPLKDLHSAENWHDLDNFYVRIRENVIFPLREKSGIKNFALEPLLVIKKKLKKDTFGDFLRKDKLIEPEYLKAKYNEELIKKKLDLFLMV